MISDLSAIGDRILLPVPEGAAPFDVESEMGKVIQRFINQASQINVKG
jgi:hypothetical protein